MAEHSQTTAHEVHALLMDARPEPDDANLAKAAHLAETAGIPRDGLQLETFVAIRNVRSAIEEGASAAEAELLLRAATDVALRWAAKAKSEGH